MARGTTCSGDRVDPEVGSVLRLVSEIPPGKKVYDDGGVGGGESRVRESEGGDRIDRRMGSLFGLRRFIPRQIALESES
ncbi:hypothetical protein Tco_0408908 [Tanacetum coccineum]